MKLSTENPLYQSNSEELLNEDGSILFRNNSYIKCPCHKDKPLAFINISEKPKRFGKRISPKCSICNESTDQSRFAFACECGFQVCVDRPDRVGCYDSFYTRIDVCTVLANEGESNEIGELTILNQLSNEMFFNGNVFIEEWPALVSVFENQDTAIIGRIINNFVIRCTQNRVEHAVVYTFTQGIIKKLLKDKRIERSTKLQAFKIAVQVNNFPLVKFLMQSEGIDPSFDNNFAIRDACEFGYFQMAESLLKCKKVDPTADDNYALQMAALNGHLSIIKLLLTHPQVDPSANSNYAIAAAAGNGHDKIVDLLLSQNSGIPRIKLFQQEVLNVFPGLRKALKVSASRYVDPAVEENNPIRWASERGHDKVVKRLLKERVVNPAVDDNFSLKWAARNGHEKVVKLLLQDLRVKPGADNNFAIKWAARNGHVAVVQILLKDKRVDPSAEKNFALKWAARNGHTSVVKQLLAIPLVDPSDENNYALQWASKNGHLSTVQLLLQHEKVDPSSNNNSALRWAAQKNHLDVVKLLLNDSRVDANADNGHALRWAKRNDNTEMIALLEENEKPFPE